MERDMGQTPGFLPSCRLEIQEAHACFPTSLRCGHCLFVVGFVQALSVPQPPALVSQLWDGTEMSQE